MDPRLRRAILQSYRPDGPFAVFGPARLKQLFARHGIDPARPHPWVYDVESLSHFCRSGVLALARAIRVGRRSRVLSLGEGNGAPSRLLARDAGCRVTGVDINPRQVAFARGTAPLHGLGGRLDYVCQDVQLLNLGRRRFDRLLINESIAHWPDKLEALRRAARHLLPGSLAGANEWLAGDEGGLGDAARRVAAFRGLYRLGVWFQPTLGELRRVFEEAGFEVLSARDVTREVDEALRRRLDGLRAFRRRLSADERRGIPYIAGMIATHYRFLRYGRLVARLAPGPRAR